MVINHLLNWMILQVLQGKVSIRLWMFLWIGCHFFRHLGDELFAAQNNKNHLRQKGVDLQVLNLPSPIKNRSDFLVDCFFGGNLMCDFSKLLIPDSEPRSIFFLQNTGCSAGFFGFWHSEADLARLERQEEEAAPCEASWLDVLEKIWGSARFRVW